MKEKRNILLPVLMMLVLAATRFMVGVLPQNFSPIYALAFCGAVYFSGRLAWWVPLGTLLATDIILNVFFYGISPLGWFMLTNYLGFGLIILVGRRFKPGDSLVKLLGGGIVGAILFYLITNTASWMSSSVYAKTLAGWIQALTVGEPGYPPTWEFFRNTLMSGGLFTGLFAGSMKLAEAAEKPEPEEEKEPESAPEAEPEESKS